MEIKSFEIKKESKRISDKKYRDKCRLNGIPRKKLTEEQKNKRKEYLLEYNKKNKDLIKQRKSISYKKRKDSGKIDLVKIKNNKKKYYDKNRERINEMQRIRYSKNIELNKAKRRERFLLNKDAVRERNRKYVKNKRETDTVFLIKVRLRRRLSYVFDSFLSKKPCSTHELLGCDWAICKNHLESLFKEGMSWENRKLWHIDHIIPLASAKTEEEMIKLCHYKNLQPLWAIDNIKKGSNILTNIKNN